MAYRIQLASKAAKNLARVDATLKSQLEKRLTELSVNPFENSKQLRNWDPPSRSSRVRDWRIVFEVDTDAKVVVVANIDARGSVY